MSFQHYSPKSIHIVALFIAVWMASFTHGSSQVAPGYEVATWYQFKKAAVTYTFDDNTPKQLTVAIPIFDTYNFKATLFPVTDWKPDWAGMQSASDRGHEVASHTLSHPHLDALSPADQENELKTSQSIINSKIAHARCLTIAYPFCAPSDKNLTRKYFIAGRICSGMIEKSTPQDFYRISALTAGSLGPYKLAADFNKIVSEAKDQGGWCVFMIHGIDDDGGYSPLQSKELNAHLAFVSAHPDDYWVATFLNAVKYIRERNALSVNETAVKRKSLKITITDTLDHEIYNLPVTLRRELPAHWKNAQVYAGGKTLFSSMTSEGTKRFVVFDVTPGKKLLYVIKAR